LKTAFLHAQIGGADPALQACAELFVQAAEKPAFYQLRTVEQLGYVVAAHMSSMRRVVAFAVRVQSPKTKAARQAERVAEWLAGFRAQLAGEACLAL
jgi:insulysin